MSGDTHEREYFYVYIHKRVTDGKVFYVGKGYGKRAWDKRKRGNHWNSTASKHGCYVKIVHEKLREADAFDFEVSLIKNLKSLGAPLVNKTNGGQGQSGNGYKVYCSNGMSFETHGDAERWLATIGFDKNTRQKIGACVSGLRRSAYGYKWSSTPIEVSSGFNTYVEGNAHRAKMVKCSNGIVFSSLTEAVDWVRENTNYLAFKDRISKCSKGLCKQAYGYKWEYVDER